MATKKKLIFPKRNTVCLLIKIKIKKASPPYITLKCCDAVTIQNFNAIKMPHSQLLLIDANIQEFEACFIDEKPVAYNNSNALIF